jgi:hypothetical protein
MKKFLTFALAAALCAPAFAQRMGSTNSSAPALKQQVMVGDMKMSLDYTSITWASGSTMGRIMDKEKGARMRSRVNETASQAPLATLNTNVALMLGDLHVPAGEYNAYFTVDDDLAWHLNLAGKDKPLTLKLPLADSKHEHKRLAMPIYPTEKGIGLMIAFGNQSCMLTVTAHGAGSEKQDH